MNDIEKERKLFNELNKCGYCIDYSCCKSDKKIEENKYLPKNKKACIKIRPDIMQISLIIKEKLKSQKEKIIEIIKKVIIKYCTNEAEICQACGVGLIEKILKQIEEL